MCIHHVGFKSQSSRGNNSIKSWASVSTAPVSVSSSSSGHTSTTSSTSLSHHNSSTGGRKPWHEVSPAITLVYTSDMCNIVCHLVLVWFRTFQMTVSNSLVGRIIGKKGLKINQIQVCHVHISDFTYMCINYVCMTYDFNVYVYSVP